ncbi:MAG TPA: PP0621 family protein [Gammaproteobacteria bacterium]|nr:PP0621 family protein [Gammaproteobacteria bacterium]
MLLRLLIIAAVIWLAFKLLRPRPPRPKPRLATRRDGGRMVRCDDCGLYVPEKEAVSTGDHHYCSEAHRRRNGSS